MFFKKSLLPIVIVASITNLYADTAEHNKYLELYGQITAIRTSMVDLSLTPTELDFVIAGMQNAIDGKALPADMEVVVPKMQAFLEAKAKAYSDKLTGDFWDKLKAEGKAKFTPSGLAYEIIEAGDPRLPKANSFVIVNLEGRLIDGTLIAKTAKEPARFILNSTIDGLSEGIQKIGRGGKIKLYIPPELAYGEDGSEEVPPNSTLIFEIEIIDVADPPPLPEGLPFGA